MRGGEYRQAAKDLVVDRLEFQQRLNRIVEYEIRFAQSIADQRAALSYVDDAIRQFGPTPELSAQKALIHLRTGDADAATAALNAAKSRAGGVERVIDETLGATRPQAMIEAQHHTRVADWLQWQRTADRSGTVVADVRGGRVTFTLRVDKAWQGRSIPPSEVGALLEDRTVVVYLHDHPSLNNIDVFSTPGRRSLQQLVQSQRLTLRELELDDVARLRPERLARTIDRPTGFNLVPPAAPDAPFGGGPSTGGDDDEERRRQRKARVVIIEIQQ
jgi:hypothetical protein